MNIIMNKYMLKTLNAVSNIFILLFIIFVYLRIDYK